MWHRKEGGEEATEKKQKIEKQPRMELDSARLLAWIVQEYM